MIQSLGYSGLSRVVLLRQYRVKRPNLGRVGSKGCGSGAAVWGSQESLLLSSVTMCVAALEPVDGTSQSLPFVVSLTLWILAWLSVDSKDLAHDTLILVFRGCSSRPGLLSSLVGWISEALHI